MNTLEQVRAKVIEVIPFEEMLRRAEAVQDPNDFEITLADVLRAIAETKDGFVSVDQDGNLRIRHTDRNWHFAEKRSGVAILSWNLSLPLDEQEPEVIDFLASVLSADTESK